MSMRYFSMHRYFVVVAAAVMSWAAPAAAADSVTATYVGTIEKKQVSIVFKDVYAVRAVSSRGSERILVYLTDSPMDKKAMTAALRKTRKTSAITTFGDFLDGKAKAHITIERGEVANLYLFQPPSLNLNAGRSEMLERGKSEFKVTGSQLEGRFTAAGTAETGSVGKIDVRILVTLADVGGPVED